MSEVPTETKVSREEKTQNGQQQQQQVKAKSSKRSSGGPMESMLPAHKIWRWEEGGGKVKDKKSKRIEHKKVIRGDDESVRVGECAVFLSTGNPIDRPFVGRVNRMWETAAGLRKVRVKWFYHADETKTAGKKSAISSSDIKVKNIFRSTGCG